MTSRRLVVLDFSGTLSPGATGFAEPETLEAALRSSGLAGLGVTRDIFWDAVAQTWEQASTTGVGYARSMAGAMADRLGVEVGSIIGAARSFTAAYLAASTVAAEWETGLRELVSRCRLVVASDHYAEATAHIVSELERLGLEARPVTEPAPGSILVATSPDLGSRKQAPEFWKAVHSAIGPVDSLAVVDDFGANEHSDDPYGAEEEVAERREATVRVLGQVFEAPVDVFEFRLDGRDFRSLVGEAVTWALRWSEGETAP